MFHINYNAWMCSLQVNGLFYKLWFRIIVQHMDQFKGQKEEVTWHIPSKYSREMATKSKSTSQLTTLDIFLGTIRRATAE